MAGDADALAKAKLQLDFIPLADMVRLASLEAPQELELLTLQAAAGVLDLCSGIAQELAWEQLKPHLTDPASLISQLRGYEPSGNELDVLELFFRREEFRPECLAIASGPSSFAICSWCLGVYLNCGGSPPAPATEEVLARLRAVAQKSQAAQRRQQAHSEIEEAADLEEGEESDEEGEASATIRGGLRILSIGGEELAVLKKAKGEWIRSDLRIALKKSCPDMLGSSDDSIYSFISGDVYLKGKTTLADLGLDPRSAEGGEIVAVAKPFTLTTEAQAALELGTEMLKRMSKGDIQEVASMVRPPQLCEDVVAAVYAVCHPKVDPNEFCWKCSRDMLRRSNFLQQLMNFDLKKDPEAVVTALESVMAREDMIADVVKRCSLAAAGLVTWLRGIYTCSRILLDAMQ